MTMSLKNIKRAVLAVAFICALTMPSILWGAEAKPAKPAAAVPATPQATEKRGSVIAVVNGADIPLVDFYRDLAREQQRLLNSGRVLTCGQIAKLRTDVAENLVRKELLYQECRKRAQVSGTEIDKEVKKARDQYATDADFTNALRLMGMSLAMYRNQVERALVVQKGIDSQFTSKVVVADKEIWAYYDRNRDSFRQPEQVRASHILIKVDPQWDAAKKAASRKKIDEISAKAKQGQDFASLARAYSEDASASQGGDLGYIRTGQVLKPVEDALFSVKPGEVSEVIESPVGYHIVKAVERKPETTVPFESVKDRLRELLKQEKGQQEAIAYIGKVREKAKVDIFLPSDE